MKHILLIGLVALNSFALQAVAQDSTTAKKTPQEKLQAQSQKLKKQLNLTPQQEVSVDSINKIFMQQAAALHNSNDNRMGKMKIIKKAQEDKNTAMKTILDEQQYAQYEQLQYGQKEKLRERIGNRRKG